MQKAGGDSFTFSFRSANGLFNLKNANRSYSLAMNITDDYPGNHSRNGPLLFSNFDEFFASCAIGTIDRERAFAYAIDARETKVFVFSSCGRRGQ